jgi:hypothetical protein
MLKPPSDYQLTKVSLTNRSTKINNLFFDSAIIFFTPKVADKGVDISTLVCTIVQIIDRGEWGKEEVPFTVDASSFSNRKHREFDLTADAEYSLKIIPPPELRMGILEIYFDPTTKNTMAQFNNPVQVNTDLSSVVSAINAGSAATVAAQEAAAAAAARKVIRIEDGQYAPISWSGKASDHVAIFPDSDRGSVSIFNPTTERIAVDLFLNLDTKSGTPQHDGFLEPGGTYTLNAEDAFSGVLLYTLNGSAPGAVQIDLGYYSVAPVAQA